MASMRTGGCLVFLAALTLAACGGGGEAESAEDVVGCFEDAGLTEVENGEVSDAEDVDAFEGATGEADDFVSARDSENRDVYVLLFESEEDAEGARDDVGGDREVGVRDDKLLAYSSEIGPEDRNAVEDCFIAQ